MCACNTIFFFIRALLYEVIVTSISKTLMVNAVL